MAPPEIDSNPTFANSDHIQPLDSSSLQSAIPELAVTDTENIQDIEQVWEELLSIPELQVIVVVI